MIRRPDIALFVLALAVTALVCLLLIISTAPVKSTTSQVWRPVPAALFSRWDAGKLAQLGETQGDARPRALTVLSIPTRWPAVPVDAGQSATSTGVKQAASSILPSGRPTGGLIPPFVAEKGVAGISPLSHGAPNDRAIKGIATFFSYVPGQAAAAARLRDVLGPDWRGMVVEVCNNSKTFRACLDVTLTDWESSLIPGRLIDLDARDFAAICGPLSTGVCDVTISHG